MVDSAGDVAMSKFEVLTAMAFAAFADAPVDVGVVEVGLGGGWDATNVATRRVAVVTPVGIDHVEYLGSDIERHRRGRRPGSSSRARSRRRRAAARGGRGPPASGDRGRRDGRPSRPGVRRARPGVAVGGQLLDAAGPRRRVQRDLPAAARRAPGVQRVTGAGRRRGVLRRGQGPPLDIEAVRRGVRRGRSSRSARTAAERADRLRRRRAQPARRDGAGRRAEEEFGFRKLIAVVGVMADKDATGILAALEPVVDEIVVTQNRSPRAMDGGRCWPRSARESSARPGGRGARAWTDAISKPRSAPGGRRGGRGVRWRRHRHRVRRHRGRGTRVVRQGTVLMTAPTP